MSIYHQGTRKQRFFIKFFIQAAVLFMIIIGISYCSSTYDVQYSSKEERTVLYREKAEIMLADRDFKILLHLGVGPWGECHRFMVEHEQLFNEPTEVKVCPRGEGAIYIRGEDGFE